MALVSLEISGFRNIEDSVFDFSGPEFFFVGENAHGKTNILEAIYYLSYGTSFRKTPDSDCVKHGASGFKISGIYNGHTADTLEISFNNKKKRIFLDGKESHDRIELIERQPCISFLHQDMEFINGTHEQRRWFFDQTIGLVSIQYLYLLRKFRKILKTRNLCLLSRDEFLMEALDTQLAYSGKEIVDARENIIHEFNEVFAERFQTVSGLKETVTIEYCPSWKDTDSPERIIEILRAKKETDFAMKTTTTGPHRDRFKFSRKGSDFVQTASTGQCRLLALLLRVSQAVFYERKMQKKPVLLLDDVLLELDPEKRKRFFLVLPPYEQAFFTFLPGEPYGAYRGNDTVIYSVTNGQITGTQSL